MLGLEFRAEVLRIEEFTVFVEFSIIEETKIPYNPNRTLKKLSLILLNPN